MVHSIGNVHEQELLQRANGSAHTLKLSNPKNMHSMNREKKKNMQQTNKNAASTHQS